MAHSIEIRVPLVDTTLLEMLAPAIPSLAPQARKEALAKAPTIPLPTEVVARAKTGFAVPTGAWMNAGTDRVGTAAGGRPMEARGLISRRWSGTVLHGFA